ncbi:tetratricopeptide repeat protein [Candidatus Poribacteria bacterium]
MGDLANAYQYLGRFDEALEAAKRGLTIDRDLGHDRSTAASLAQIAAILVEQQRYAEADARYDEALSTARAAGDLGLQGSILQHQGILQDNMGNNDRAVDLYRQAINLFQRANNPGSEMRTCNQLAMAERNRSHLDAAEAWYDRARELALKLNDRYQLAIIAQNVSILYQTRAQEASDPEARIALLRQATTSVDESLKIKLEMDNQVGAAASYSQLGILYQMLGDLDQAEENSKQALEIRKSLNLPDVYKSYGVLAEIARARGDQEAAAEWQAKYEAKVAELEKLRRGEGAGGQPAGMQEQVVKAIMALAQAAFNARKSNALLPPEAAELLAQITQLPPPMGGIGPFLQAIAQGEDIPPMPPELPPELGEILNSLVEAIRQV